MVDRVHVLHAVDNNLAHLLEALVPAHGRDRVALHEDVTLREELDGLWAGLSARDLGSARTERVNGAP